MPSYRRPLFAVVLSLGATLSVADVGFAVGSGTTRYGYDMLQHGPLVGLTLRF